MLFMPSTGENDFAIEPTAIPAWVEGRIILVEWAEGRLFGFPADRFRILKEASDEQLRDVSLRLDGYALRGEELGEEITIPGTVAGHFQLPREVKN